MPASVAESETDDRTIATAWASSRLGPPSPEDDATVVTIAPPADVDRRPRGGPVVLFCVGCVVAAAVVGALILGSTGTAGTVRITPGVTDSSSTPAQPTKPTEPIVATKPGPAAPQAPAWTPADIPSAPAPEVAQPPAPAPAPEPAPEPPLPPETPLPPLSEHPVQPVPPAADVPDVPDLEAPPVVETPDPPKPVAPGPTDLTVEP